MGTVAGSASIQLGELIGDRVRFWRFKQFLKLAERAKQMLDERELDPQAVPFKTLVPIVEQGSLEDDDDLTERWAALLANAASGGDVPPSFASVLGEMGPVEARMLEQLYMSAMRAAPQLRGQLGISRDGFPGIVPPERYDFYADNMRRLGLARTPDDSLDPDLLILTHFAIALVRACRPPGAQDPPIVFQSLAEIREHNRRLDEREEQAGAAAERAAPDASPDA